MYFHHEGDVVRYMVAISVIAFAALFVLAFLAKTHRPPFSRLEELPGSSWAGFACFSFLVIFFGVFAAMGNIISTPAEFALLNVVIVACAWVSLYRRQIRNWLSDLHVKGRRISIPIEIAMLGLGAYLGTVALEMPSNPTLTQFNLAGLLVEIVVLFIVTCCLHMLFQRSGIGAALSIVLFEFIGIVEYFVVTFKDVPLMASDVLAIGTAAAVSGDYRYQFNSMAIGGITLAVAVALLVSLTPRPRSRAKKDVGRNVGVAVALAVALVCGVLFVDLTDTFGVTVGGWLPLASYNRQGFVSSFIASVQNLRPEKPRRYSNDAAEETIASYAATYDQTTGASAARAAAQAQFEELHPTVIVVMNETFSDMSIYNELNCGYTGPAFVNSMNDSLYRGSLYVSPYGGGTCNSEFEFLTGLTTAFMGNSVYPYMVYDLSGVENMARQFADMGYVTTAMHPNHAANWNRNVVYEDFGFQTFLELSDFAGSERLRGRITDAATYDKILDLLEQDSSPQFIFNVTMQNHGGYDSGLIPEDMRVHYPLEGLDEQQQSSLDEFLACINESDRALEEFIGELEQLDRPVVLVFFGDHQPKGARAYNDIVFAEEPDDVAHEERTRVASYTVWANYDIAGFDPNRLGATRATSTNYLGALTLSTIGAPLTDYQKAELALSERMPLINLMGYADDRGRWYAIARKKGDTGAFRRDLEVMQYYQMYRDGVHYQLGAGVDGVL